MEKTITNNSLTPILTPISPMDMRRIPWKSRKEDFPHEGNLQYYPPKAQWDAIKNGE
jgi:hypothetical protein